MTAPADYEWRPGQNTVLPVTYSVDGLTLGRHDEHGNWWIPQETEGWHESADPRDSSSERPNGHGSFTGVTYMNQREIVISGLVLCPDVSARLKAQTLYNALCTDPGRLYEFLAVDQAGERVTCQVKRGGRPKFRVLGERKAEYQLTLSAPDPRKHDHAWQEPITNFPSGGVFGLDFGGAGLDFSGAGLDFGTPEPAPLVQVANHGTAPAYPMFKLTGPLSFPTITHLESGRVIRYSAEIAAGEVVWINCDDFAARGILPHGRTSNLRGNVASLFTIGAQWPVVNPQETAHFRLGGSGPANAELMCLLRSAWF